MPVARSTVQGFLLVEALLFLAAALVHRGLLIAGYAHERASIAESVIAAVLTAGLIISAVRPFAARRAALFVQALALFGACGGVVMILIGVGPRTPEDLILHAVMLFVLVTGLVFASRSG